VEEQPYIDEHAHEVDAPPVAVWGAVHRWLDGVAANGAARLYLRAVGCEDEHGFHVESETEPSEVVLAGRHRFSTYSLIFRIDDLGGGRSRLRAESRGRFPGVGGAVYRALVIGTRGHVLAVRRLLAGIGADAAGG
jgi:hypothetical protein